MDRWLILKLFAVSILIDVLYYLYSTTRGSTILATIALHNITEEAVDEPTRNETEEKEEVFIDEYFEPIMETFRHPEQYKMKKDFRNGSEPTILVVSSDLLSSVNMQESFYHIKHNECPLPCRLIEDRTKREFADAILFYLYDVTNADQLKDKFESRDLSQPWIVHATECPATAKRNDLLTYKSLNGIFNRTSYFRRDADVLWTHGFVVSRKDANLLPSSWHLKAPPISKKPFDKRKMAVAFISNCNDRSGRLKYIREFSKHFTVHIFGKCGRRICGESRFIRSRFRVEKDDCLRRAAEDYLFYLSFENNISEDYVTEKVYNILYYPVVPVVFGGANYTKLLPPNSYVNALQFSPKKLAEHLTELASDENKYKEKLKWRKHYVASTVANRMIYCQLCTKLYDPVFYSTNVYNDLQDWFVFKSHSNRRYIASRNVTELKEDIE